MSIHAESPFDGGGQLYFLHIPKTAGTSFSSFLDEQFSPVDILEEKVWNNLLPRLREQNALNNYFLKDYRFMRGHFGRCLHRYTNKQLTTITFLRNPIERTMSQYRHIIRDQTYNNWLPPDFGDSGITDINNAKIVFSNPIARKFFSDMQTRFLALDIDMLSISKTMPPNQLESLYYPWVPSFMYPSAPKFALKLRAKQYLNTLDFVGIQEYYEISILVFCYKFKLPPPVKLQERLMSFSDDVQERYIVTAELLPLLKELNKADQSVYEYGLHLLNTRYRQMTISLTGNDPGNLELLSRENYLHLVNSMVKLLLR